MREAAEQVRQPHISLVFEMLCCEAMRKTFVSSKSSAYATRKLFQSLRQAESSCQSLDERLVLLVHLLLSAVFAGPGSQKVICGSRW